MAAGTRRSRSGGRGVFARDRGAAAPLRRDRHPERRELGDRAEHRLPVRPPEAPRRRADRDRRRRRPDHRLRRRARHHPRHRPGARPSPSSPTSTPRRSSTPPASARSSTAPTTAAPSASPTPPTSGSRPSSRPISRGKVGDDIVTASGTTLLGADDKAGIAIVMTAARHLLADPGIAHGPIRIAFTPDEEIGRGVHADLPGDLGAGIAYTFDGGDRGEIAFETFSADRAVVKHRRRLDPPGLGQGQARQRPPPRRPHHRDPAPGHPHPRDHRRPRGLHPPLRDVGHRRRGRAALHPARLRARRPRRPRRPRPPGRRGRRRHRAARPDLGRDHPPVPQHALLARERHAPGRPRPRRLPRHRHRARTRSRSAAAPTARA